MAKMRVPQNFTLPPALTLHQTAESNSKLPYGHESNAQVCDCNKPFHGTPSHGSGGNPDRRSDKGLIDSHGKFVAAGSASVHAPGSDVAAEEKKLRESIEVLPDGPNRFRIGEISFDRVRREVTIPAIVNMASGVVEYALVTEKGKVHEALFSTKGNPREIHIA